MDIAAVSAHPPRHACDALAVGIREPLGDLGPVGSALEEALGGRLLRTLKEERFVPRPGAMALIHTHDKIAPRRLIVVGLGPGDRLTPEVLRTAAAAAARRAQELQLSHVALSPLQGDARRLRTMTQARVEGAILGAYAFTRYKQEPAASLTRLDVLVEADGQGSRTAVEEGINAGRLFADATVLARDLVNEPPNVKTPAFLAEQAVQAGKRVDLKVTLLGRQEMERLGMRALLAVARGSSEEPYLVVMDYAPRGAKRTVALVGKGLTFDSGGLDIKSADQMATMKLDMSGAAAVLGAMSAVPKITDGVRVIGLLACAENMPGPGAMKPGDVIKALNGKTIEITNTDAEGRMVLADALTYAVQLGADELIDIATLTGGAVVALGYVAAAVLGTDRRIVEDLQRAGDAAGERIWPLPLYPEFSEIMKSRIADVRNSAGRYGSPIKGAAFLKEFTEGKPWAHLDIASTAFMDSEEGTGPYRPKGSATGFGVRTFLHYLQGQDAGQHRA